MRRILIVEDDPDALELLVSWMRHQRGWDVRSAQSGQSAIELSHTFKPEVVIADYLLQDGVTGVDVIAEVQSHEAPVRCVLVTGVLRQASLDAQRINGVPILTRDFADGKADSEMRLTVVRKESVPGGSFEVPAGYAEKKMSFGPGAAQ